LATDDLLRLRRVYAERDRRFAQRGLYSDHDRAYAFLRQRRQQTMRVLLARFGILRLNPLRILELGCGLGGVLRELLREGAQAGRLFGTDLIEARVRRARTNLPALPLTCADGQDLPYRSGSFDLVLQFTVFSSVLDRGIQERMAQEMLRLLTKPGGLILWYDYWWNPINHQTRGIRPTEVRRLFPGCRFHFSRITLAPPLARRLAPLSPRLAQGLEYLKLFNTHFLAVIQPGA
jgi:SAM-dependent methyltransferase